ncbi:prepilin-type N-terminal cleavage/methylation domain-containing protein [Acinetobacter haemolyticus]|uniref:prepilin-type N-terminal cleavage/methylation domain-containing protein n=1 Tax=Acinetobacter haemolyticus TaxID=29430 RepID=UPI003D1ACB08
MQKGFTLIELLIVVAIIGIITAIIIPVYHLFVVKTRIHTAMYEISSAKPAYEIIVTQNTPASITPADLYIQAETRICHIRVTVPDLNLTETKVLSCIFKEKSSLHPSAEIYLTRTALGQYSCKTTGIPHYLIPKECI